MSVGVQLKLDDTSMCESASIVVGGLSSLPARATAASKHLIGNELTAKTISRAAELASQEVDVRSDFRASEDYRRSLITHYVGTLTQTAVERARGLR